MYSLGSGSYKFGPNDMYKDQNNYSPLHMAVENGCAYMVQYWLKEGIYVNSKIPFNGFTPLDIAVSKNDLTIVRILIANGADINNRSMGGFTPLVGACQLGLLDLVKILIDSGAQIGVKTDNFSTLLHFAADNGHDHVIKFLIEKGLDVNAANKNKAIPLHHACLQGYVNVVKTLLSHRSAVNARATLYDVNYQMAFSNVTPLHIAIMHKQVSMVKELIRAGAQVNAMARFNAIGSYQITPLHIASQNCHLEIMRMLVAEKANVNVKTGLGFIPLHNVILLNNYEASNYLIRNGSNVNALCFEDWTPLHCAICNDDFSLKIMEPLINYGSCVNARTKDGKTPLHFVAERNILEMAKLLIKNNADTDALDNFKWSPLHLAASYGYSAMCTILLKSGANIEAKNVNYSTPLHLAVSNCHTETVQLLLTHGANVNEIQESNGFSALHIASMKGYDALSAILLEHGADMNLKEYTAGATPLHTAVLLERTKLACNFIIRGADVNTETYTGLTPLHSAAEFCNFETAKCLVQHGAYYDAKVKEGDYILPMDFAVKSGAKDVINLLKLTEKLFMGVKNSDRIMVENCFKEGAFANSNSVHFKSILHYASWRGRDFIVNIIIKNGAQVNAYDNEGRTPLHYASMYNRFGVAIILLQNGAMYNIPSPTTKKTPLDLAMESSNYDIVHLLELVNGIFEDIKLGNRDLEKEFKEMRERDKVLFLAIANSRDSEGHSIVQKALQNGHSQLAQSISELLSN